MTASLLLYGNAVSSDSVTFTYSPGNDFFVEGPAVVGVVVSPDSVPNFPHPLMSIVETSLSLAARDSSRLPPEVLNMPGMSGSSFRHFINNLVGGLPAESRSYLEVGVWSGSSFTSALHGNGRVRAVAVDNWSQYGGPKDVFLSNVGRHCGDADVLVLEADCWSVDADVLEEFGGFTVYFFDGPHEVLDHYRSIVEYFRYLSDVSVVVVDDWNFVDVRYGTERAISHLPAEVLYKKEITTTRNVAIDETEWHNGVAIYILKKI